MPIRLILYVLHMRCPICRADGLCGANAGIYLTIIKNRANEIDAGNFV
jgi:hypothetical protein